METSIPIYIINLKRNPERKLFMRRQLDALNLNYQFVDAIDKYDLESSRYQAQIARSLNIDPSALEYKYSKVVQRSKTNKKYRNEGSGCIACLLSHIKTYNLMIENNDTMACILEDDAILLPTFREILNIATKLEWDILLLASYPSNPLTGLMRSKCTKRIPIFNKDLLFNIKNRNHSSKQKHRIKCILEEYGFNHRLYPEQSKIIVKAIQEHDTRYAEITKTITSDCRLSLVKHEQYLVYKALRRYIKDYAFLQIGALPEKSSLNPISDHHCIAELREPCSAAAAYFLKKEAAMKWKRHALAENPLVIDEIPWRLYRYKQVKLRLITPPCATVALHYLIHSARCR